MSDLHPILGDTRHQSRFKLATNRQQDLVIQQELEDVAKKSTREIASRKEEKKQRPLTDSEQTSL